MLDFLYNPQGRISRKGYFVAFFLPYLALTQFLPMVFAGTPLSFIFALITLFYLWPSIGGVPIKRFHDMGLTGWYQAGVVGLTILAAIIVTQGVMGAGGDRIFEAETPAEQQEIMFEVITESSRAQLGLALAFLVNLAQFVLFVSVKGQAGPNRFGNDPLAEGRGYAD